MMLRQVLEEIVRAREPIRPEVFRRWQQEIKHSLAQADTEPVVTTKPSLRRVSA